MSNNDLCPTYRPDEIIVVWRVSYGRTHYVTDREPLPEDLGEGEVVTKDAMKRGEYDALPEFTGF